AGDPCWATLNAAGRYPGGSSEGLTSGERPGTDWIPPECDVSIRPGWFYHSKEDTQVKSPHQLLDIYYKSVGRGACLNLNVPPDRRGRINQRDVESLRAFRKVLDATFATNLAKGAKLSASAVRGNDARFGTEVLTDGDHATYWATDDGVTEATVVVDFGKATTFNVIDLREHLPLGQRVEAFVVEAWQNGDWVNIADGTSIG